MLTCLHYTVFIPRIQQALEFKQQYNHHRLRTEHDLTPHQLFIASPLTVDRANVDPTLYGVEEEGQSRCY